MKDNLTEIAFVLDRSGSMESMRAEAMGGFNAFLDGQKKEPGEANLTAILFDHEYLAHCTHLPLREVQPLTSETYVPRGTTALHDAIGTTIDKLGIALDQTLESDRPARVLFVILTDGFENASKKYSLLEVNDRIKHQREKYSWQFIFLGAGLGVAQTLRTSQNLGIPATHAVAAQASGQGMQQAMQGLNCTTNAYRRMKDPDDQSYLRNLGSAGVWGGDPLATGDPDEPDPKTGLFVPKSFK